MKNGLALFVALLVLIGVSSCGKKEQVFYVSLIGSDTNTGTFEQPLKSVEQALKLAKENKEHSPNQVIRIVLRGGTYQLKRTLQLNAELSGTEKNPFVIESYKGEDVAFTGANTLNLKWEKVEGQLMKAKVPQGIDFEWMYLNGERMVRARYPNYNPAIRIYGGYGEDALAPERVKTWKHPQNGVVHAIHSARWGGYHYRITGVDEKGVPTFEGGWQNNRQMGMHKQFRFVENIFEELDAPKEWFLNKETNTLYFYPEQSVDLTKAKVEVPIMTHLIDIVGTENEPVKNITIRGIDFRCTIPTYMQTKEPLLRSDWTIYRGGAILIEGATDITISGGHFDELGGNGIFVSNYARRINIESNHFEELGASAISFVGSPDAVRSPSFEYHESVAFDKLDRTVGPKNNTYPAECRVYDNLIHDIGKIEKQIAGVQISMAAAITVSHNTIYNLPRAGINVSEGTWGGHIIEYNDVFNTVLETSDHGAFNSWGRDRFWHPNRGVMDKITTKEPSLILLDAKETTIIRNNRFRCDHGWDIDLDDGSSNYHIYNNVCLSGGIKLREGFYRTVENNITINNSIHPHVWFKESHDVIKHNVLTSWYKPIRVPVWGDTVDYNFFPDLEALKKSHKLGLDEHSAYGDPMFIDPEKADYRVGEKSKALTIGFKNFPMDQFGVVSSNLKSKAASPIIPKLFITSFQKNKDVTYDFLGAKVRKVKGIGEVSAAGLKDENAIYIVELPKKSLAYKQGLRASDAIIALSGHKTGNVRQLMEAYEGEKWKGHVALTVVRNQKEEKLNVSLH
ncbi:PDZ domain-containing protein [Prolixibacteraceae bacterium JC049]|nr:PDZ domain-containing protein [Prolixibacteraceae bacterium JC049]